MSRKTGVRALAAQGLKRIAIDGASLREVFIEFSTKIPDSRDRALLHSMLFESSRWYQRIDLLLARLLDQPLQHREPVLHCLLAVGVAQLEYMNLPEYAAVAATVEAARELKRPHLANLVNAVLRRYQRERAQLNAALDEQPIARYSHPRWLIDALQTDWPQHWTSILNANNTPAPLWLRINRRVTSPAVYRTLLTERNIGAQIHTLCPDALVLETSVDVTLLPGYAEGAFSVQDGAAQLAADLLELKPNLHVLDACAAPGGKTSHILEREQVELVALDRDKTRLPRIADNLARLGLKAELLHADAGAPDTWWDGRAFDRILLDAPCSASGIIRRQPDIKLHRRRDDLIALCIEQTRLLNALWPLLRPGGRLVYATCSILCDENKRPIESFLAHTSDAYATSLPLPEWNNVADVGRQNLPGDAGMDGFFYAVLEKKT